MLNAAFPVGATLATLTLSGLFSGKAFKNLIRASYNAFVTVLLPTPAPPLKNSLNGTFPVLTEFSTW